MFARMLTVAPLSKTRQLRGIFPRVTVLVDPLLDLREIDGKICLTQGENWTAGLVESFLLLGVLGSLLLLGVLGPLLLLEFCALLILEVLGSIIIMGVLGSLLLSGAFCSSTKVTFRVLGSFGF